MVCVLRGIVILFLLRASIQVFSADIPKDWDTLPTNETSILITYVENMDGIPGTLAQLPIELSSDAALSRLWDPDDPANQPKNLKNRKIEEDGDYIRVISYTAQVLWATFDYRIEWFFDRERQTISWTLVDGDLECLEGHWKVLDETQNRTYMEYVAFTRPKLGFLNSFLKPIYLQEMKKFLIDKQLKLR